MPYKYLDQLRPSLQPAKLIENELTQFDNLVPEIKAQFEQLGDASELDAWLLEFRGYIETQQMHLPAILELVIQYVEKFEMPTVTSAD